MALMVRFRPINNGLETQRLVFYKRGFFVEIGGKALKSCGPGLTDAESSPVERDTYEDFKT